MIGGLIFALGISTGALGLSMFLVWVKVRALKRILRRGLDGSCTHPQPDCGFHMVIRVLEKPGQVQPP